MASADFFVNQGILELSKKLESQFIRDVIELSVAIDIQNKGWAKKTMLRMLGLGPKELTFKVQHYTYGRVERLDKFKNIINRLGDLSETLLGEPFLSKAWNDKMAESLNGRQRGGDWSLAEIRKRLKGKQVDGRIWTFLFQKLLIRTSSREASLLLKRRMDEEFIKNMNVSDIWLFGYYYPTQVVLKKKVLDKIYSAWGRNDPWLQYLVTELIREPELKTGLAKKNDFFKKSSFQIERWFYRNLLSQGRAVDFSLYNLIRLGDYNRLDLWWLAF